MIVTTTFCPLVVSVGPKVSDLVSMWKSPGGCSSADSVAVPVGTTSMANVVDDPGRWLTVTGTFSVPTFSATDAVCFEVRAASDPNAIWRVSTCRAAVPLTRICAMSSGSSNHAPESRSVVEWLASAMRQPAAPPASSADDSVNEMRPPAAPPAWNRTAW